MTFKLVQRNIHTGELLFSLLRLRVAFLLCEQKCGFSMRVERLLLCHVRLLALSALSTIASSFAISSDKAYSVLGRPFWEFSRKMLFLARAKWSHALAGALIPTILLSIPAAVG
jgi:hypothetical protein